MFTLRYAREDDVPSILKVLEKYNMHHVPSPEMPDLDYTFFYVAELDGRVVGACGYKILSPDTAKTTLLGVEPDYSKLGIGMALQAKRMAAIKSLGCEKLITNADRPDTIRWYKKHFGYYEIGHVMKEHSFGLDSVDRWTTLETDLNCFEPENFLPEETVQPLIINAAITGAIHSKENNSFLPVMPEEIASEAISVIEAGASIVHLHARDQQGNSSLDPSIYVEIIKRIRFKKPEAIICVSTTGRKGGTKEERAAVLYLQGDFKPDMASLTLGSMNFLRQASINNPDSIVFLAETMTKMGIKPETEAFELGMLDYARYLVYKKILRMPIYNNSIFGAGATLAAKEHNAELIRKALPIDTVWAVSGIGRYNKRMVEWAIINGAHVRTGLEDNLYIDQIKKIPANNIDLIKSAKEFAEQIGRPVATPKVARQIIGLK